MSHRNQRTFHRGLFAGMLETITLYKRGDDQNEGTVTTYTVFQVRRSLITKGGEPIAGDMQDAHRCIWHFARIELDRIGIAYLDPADRILDQQGRMWQPEATTEITDKLWELHVDVQTLRIH